MLLIHLSKLAALLWLSMNQYHESGQFFDVRLVQLDNDNEPRILIDRGVDARYLESGYIAYLKDGSLQIVGFDPDKKKHYGDTSSVNFRSNL